MTEQEYLKGMAELGRISAELDRLDQVYKGFEQWIEDMYTWFEANREGGKE